MCQKTKDLVILKHSLSVGDDGGGGDGGRISWPPPAPIPSRPGIQYPVRAYPSLRLVEDAGCKGDLAPANSPMLTMLKNSIV